MTVSIKKHFSHAPVQEQIEFKRMLNTVLTDLQLLRTHNAALVTSITGITAKLDLDAGVTDTNYAALHDPAAIGALTLVE